MLKEKIDQLRLLHTEIDDRISAFQKDSGLNCPPGCGLCCRSIKVEATILEMLPLAEMLYDGPEDIDWTEKLYAAKEEKHCLFFQSDTAILTNGFCRVYSFRPLICRLFGFAAYRNKNGNRKMSMCRRMRQSMADDHDRVTRFDDAAPAFVDYSIRISALHPELGSRLYPINYAAYAAFEKFALWARLKEASTSMSPENPETPTPAKRQWKRAA